MSDKKDTDEKKQRNPDPRVRAQELDDEVRQMTPEEITESCKERQRAERRFD